MPTDFVPLSDRCTKFITQLPDKTTVSDIHSAIGQGTAAIAVLKTQCQTPIASSDALPPVYIKERDATEQIVSQILASRTNRRVIVGLGNQQCHVSSGAWRPGNPLKSV